VRRLRGADLDGAEGTDPLARLEFDGEAAGDGGLKAAVPPHRLDVACAADLVEEVARIHGYDNLPATMLADPLPPQGDNPRLWAEETARDALVDVGLQEVVSYRLVAPDLDTDVAAAPEAQEAHVVLANPISPERSALRTTILGPLLGVARGNLRFVDRVAIFELGPVFLPGPGQLPAEEWRVGLVMTGPAWPTSWRGAAPRRLDFFDAKGVVEHLAAGLGADLRWASDPAGHGAMHPARTAVVRAKGLVVGHVGELRAAVLEGWSLGDGPVAVADLDLGALRAAADDRRAFRPFSPYPAVKEDVAVVVDEGVPVADVAAVIRRSAGALLADLTLFDVYRGDQIGAGRKSLAWSLALQAADKTLTSKAAAAVRGRIVRALESELGAELRGG
ncbi:MAG: phenylalanine--tRNA ligase subunit beta, partial [Anaerolineae bacterium]